MYRRIKSKSYFGVAAKLRYICILPVPRVRSPDAGYSVRGISLPLDFRLSAASRRPPRKTLLRANLRRDNKNNDRLHHDGHGRQRDADDCSSPPPSAKIVCRLFTRHVPPNASSPARP